MGGANSVVKCAAMPIICWLGGFCPPVGAVQAAALPLVGAVQTVAKQTGVLIHYAALPERLAQAACPADSLPSLLGCLHKLRVDTIVRSQDGHAVEIWLLPADHGGGEAGAGGPPPVGQQPAPMAQSQQAAIANIDPGLLALLNSADAQQRAQGVQLLATTPKLEAGQVKAMLLTATTDEDPMVRAQAVQALAGKDAQLAEQVLRAALADADEDVRMMAVEQAGANSELLQQALADTSAAVSGYAAKKLAALAGR